MHSGWFFSASGSCGGAAAGGAISTLNTSNPMMPIQLRKSGRATQRNTAQPNHFCAKSSSPPCWRYSVTVEAEE